MNNNSKMTEYVVDSKKGNRRCELHMGDVKLKYRYVAFWFCVGKENRKYDAGIRRYKNA